MKVFLGIFLLGFIGLCFLPANDPLAFTANSLQSFTDFASRLLDGLKNTITPHVNLAHSD